MIARYVLSLAFLCHHGRRGKLFEEGPAQQLRAHLRQVGARSSFEVCTRKPWKRSLACDALPFFYHLMKLAIKATMFRLFPRVATQIFSARARACSHKLFDEWGCTKLNDKLIKRFGNKVLHGPFAGIAFSPEARREHLAPFLLGTYESELQAAWNSIFQMKFNLLIDVGANFGFYAVGLAKRFPASRVVAFDTDPWARKATHEMAAANDVTVEVREFCNPEWLLNHLQKDSFILSDCEGYEATLFGSIEIPHLSSATLLVETHEQFKPGVTEMIREKFSRSHHIVVIPPRSHGAETLSELEFLDEKERAMATTEYRTAEQCWLFLTPKS
jgi:hypothetical protein